MRDLLRYYEDEYRAIRQLAGDFARNFPEAARYLDLGERRGDDPYVERLIEAFCLIAARVNHRLDADFPEISKSLLSIVFPHYLRPVPSMSILQFRLKADSSKGLLEAVPFAAGIPVSLRDAQFRTCYPVDVWPVEVVSAEVMEPPGFPSSIREHSAVGAIRLELESAQPFRELKNFNRLRFHLSGDGHTPFSLYELLFGRCSAVIVFDNETDTILRLPSEAIKQVGFGEGDAVIPFDKSSLSGFGLIQEYFCFPQKFLFFDFVGLGQLKYARMKTQTARHTLSIFFMLDAFGVGHNRLRQAIVPIDKGNFLLGCTPVINLFKKLAEPIRVDQTQAEYRVVPDETRPLETEVYSIEEVAGRRLTERKIRSYGPLFCLDHKSGESREAGTFWAESRRPSDKEGDAGTSVFLSFIDEGLELKNPAAETLSVEIMCTNRDYPSNFALGLIFGEIEFRDSRLELRFTQGITRPQRVPLDRKLDWRVISQLGLRHLSLTRGTDDPLSAAPLRELLSIYNFSQDPAIEKRIRAVRTVTSRPTRSLLRFSGSAAERDGETGGNDRGTSSSGRAHRLSAAYCNGLAIDLDLEESPFLSNGVFLFASVLERFLSLYSPINSFTQLTATVSQGREVLKRWPPRAGEVLL